VTTLPAISGRRRTADRTMRIVLGVMTLIALVPLVAIIYFLLKQGLSSFSWHFFTSDPTGSFFGDQGGIRSALLGTIEIVLMSSVLAIPLGIAIALYLVEFGQTGWFANTVRYLVDVMTGVPSIVFGLFVYAALVVSKVGGQPYTAWKAGIAIALLMLPIVIKSSEVVLLLVPNGLREAALALGTPRWRVVMRVVLPAARPGIITGSLLAIARGIGETAPLLFTTSLVLGTTTSPNAPMNALPIQIFSDINSPNSDIVARAWGGALTLVLIVLILTLIARLYASRSRIA
jgi:phosphate transport system permease protein